MSLAWKFNVFPISLSKILDKLESFSLFKFTIASFDLRPHFHYDKMPRLVEVATPHWFLPFLEDRNNIINDLYLVSSIIIDNNLISTALWYRTAEYDSFECLSSKDLYFVNKGRQSFIFGNCCFARLFREQCRSVFLWI